MLNHPDHLNTPRLVADATGTTVWRWDQAEPFGVNVPDENPSTLGAFEFPLRFPGQYADKETNLSYNYFRDYDPETGRYVQSDPIGLEGAWAKLYEYRPRYFDVRAGRYVTEQLDRMNDARYALVQGSMIFRRLLIEVFTPTPQEFNTYAYASLDSLRNFDRPGLQSGSLTSPPKIGGPSLSFPQMTDYERCLAQSCAAGGIAGLVVGRSLVSTVGGFLGGFFLGGYFCPGDPPNFTPPSMLPKNPPSAPPKSN